MKTPPNSHYSFKATIASVDIPRILREAPPEARIVVIAIGKETIIATRTKARERAFESGVKLETSYKALHFRSNHFPSINRDGTIDPIGGYEVPVGTDWYFCCRGTYIPNEESPEEVLQSYLNWFAASDEYYASLPVTTRVKVYTY